MICKKQNSEILQKKSELLQIIQMIQYELTIVHNLKHRVYKDARCKAPRYKFS